MAVNGILLGQSKQSDNNLNFSFYSSIIIKDTSQVSISLDSGYLYKLFYFPSESETNNYIYRIGLDYRTSTHTTGIKQTLYGSLTASGSALVIPKTTNSISNSQYYFMGPDYYGTTNVPPLYVFIYYPNQEDSSYYQWKTYIKYQNLTEEIITGTSFESLSLYGSSRYNPNSPKTIAKIYRSPI